jgi:hypothetical protein
VLDTVVVDEMVFCLVVGTVDVFVEVKIVEMLVVWDDFCVVGVVIEIVVFRIVVEPVLWDVSLEVVELVLNGEVEWVVDPKNIGRRFVVFIQY